MQQRCPTCGGWVEGNGQFCSYCGSPLYLPPNAPYGYPPLPRKDKIVAALLALFLGGLGIHKFYLGRTGAGLFMLLFCWTGIPSVIALVDFILLLLMSDQTFMYKYNCRIY